MNTGVLCTTLPPGVSATGKQTFEVALPHAVRFMASSVLAEDAGRRDTRQLQPKENITWQLE
jgi:hypothetical protein